MGSYFKLLFKLLLLLIVVVVLITFGIQNNGIHKIALVFSIEQHANASIWHIVYASIIIGIFIGMLVGMSAPYFSQRKKLKELQKENRDLKAKIAEAPEEKSVVESVVEENANLRRKKPQKLNTSLKQKMRKQVEEEEEKKDENETRF